MFICECPPHRFRRGSSWKWDYSVAECVGLNRYSVVPITLPKGKLIPLPSRGLSPHFPTPLPALGVINECNYSRCDGPKMVFSDFHLPVSDC